MNYQICQQGLFVIVFSHLKMRIIKRNDLYENVLNPTQIKGPSRLIGTALYIVPTSIRI